MIYVKREIKKETILLDLHLKIISQVYYFPLVAKYIIFIAIYITIITTNIAPIPIPINLKEAIKFAFMLSSYNRLGSIANITPPATTDAICPATLAPTACINKWFCESASNPNF